MALLALTRPYCDISGSGQDFVLRDRAVPFGNAAVVPVPGATWMALPLLVCLGMVKALRRRLRSG